MGKSYTRESHLSHLECTKCKKSFSPTQIIRLCSCGSVIFPKYNLEDAKETINDLTNRKNNVWRFTEIMPVIDENYQLTLGEGNTPIIKLDNLGKKLSLKSLFLKDEGLNPTGTFKSRGLCTAVSKGIELGVTDFIIPTAGNAGVALAAYSAKGGKNITAHVYMPEDTPNFIQKEVKAYGANLNLVKGLITEAGKNVRDIVVKSGYFDVSTLKEPYRVEGKKTMGIELLEQLNWTIPDVIIYPTGGGTGIVGMWKAFNELEELGFISSERPRMISVQSSTCAPIVKAFNEKKDNAEFWNDATTNAPGLRVPSAIGDYLILQSIKESKGCAIAIDDSTIKANMKDLAKFEGIFQSMEGAATLAAVEPLINSNEIDKSDHIVLFGTGSGFIYPEHWF